MAQSMSQFAAGFDYEAHQRRMKQHGQKANTEAEMRRAAQRPKKAERIINSPQEKLNKTETRFKLEWLDVWLRDGAIDRVCRHESYKLPCGAGTWLAPDFPTWKDNRLTCYEIKGAFIREDAIAKLKACASLNPEIAFYLCQWKGGRWLIQKVEA